MTMKSKRASLSSSLPLPVEEAFEVMVKILGHFGGTKSSQALRRVTGSWSKSSLGQINFIDTVVQIKPMGSEGSNIHLQVTIQSLWEVSEDPQEVAVELLDLTNDFLMGTFVPDVFVPLTKEEMDGLGKNPW